VKILSEAKIYITLMAMVIGFALYLWNGKIFLMEKKQKVIFSDESKRKAIISELEDVARKINCMTLCQDDDAERSCRKRCIGL